MDVSFLVVDSWKGVAEEAIRVFVVGGGCGQDEPGIIMRVKLATGSTIVEKTGNCPHESKIKAFFANRDRIELKLLSRKNKRFATWKIRGAFGSTSDHNFCMSMQNGSNLT